MTIMYVAFWGCTKTEMVPSKPQDDSTMFSEENILEPWDIAPVISQSDQHIHFELRAQQKTHRIYKDDEEFEIAGYAYNAQTPAPIFVAQKGQMLQVDFWNDLDVPTTVHWHGLKSPESMDGVPYVYDPILPQQKFEIEIPLEQEGTFWFHPHYDTDRQVDLGLYGMLVVEDPETTKHPFLGYPKRFLVFDDWNVQHLFSDLEENQSEHSHLYQEGIWLVNQMYMPQIIVDQPTIFHVVNASNQGYLDIYWPNALWIGGEQGYFGSYQEANHIVLAPGDRIVVLDLGGNKTIERRPYSNHGGSTWEEPTTLFEIEGLEFERPTLMEEIENPSIDPQTTDAVLVFQGNPYTDSWYINGAQFPNVEPIRWKFGFTGVLEVRNLSPTEHPFHLHGLLFEVLSVDGIPPQQKQIEDTINVGIYQSVRLLITADNIGQWMAHCHILPHGDGGMMTIFEVYE